MLKGFGGRGLASRHVSDMFFVFLKRHVIGRMNMKMGTTSVHFLMDRISLSLFNHLFLFTLFLEVLSIHDALMHTSHHG